MANAMVDLWASQYEQPRGNIQIPGLAPALHSSDQAWVGKSRRQAERSLETEDRGERPVASGSSKGARVKGYVVVFEGDDADGYSAYSPDLPGVVAAGETRAETERLM